MLDPTEPELNEPTVASLMLLMPETSDLRTTEPTNHVEELVCQFLLAGLVHHLTVVKVNNDIVLFLVPYLL